MDRTTILAISGSLRRGSYNSAALDALSMLSPPDMEVRVYRMLGDIPLFNPDLDPERVPAVEQFKKALGEAEGLVIASPEYAHGISGVLKNALDWLVSGEEFVSMPVALINTSPRAYHAQMALREVVTTMSGIIIEDACISIPLLGSGLGSEDIKDNKKIAGSLLLGLSRFHQAIEKQKLNTAVHATST